MMGFNACEGELEGDFGVFVNRCVRVVERGKMIFDAEATYRLCGVSSVMLRHTRRPRVVTHKLLFQLFLHLDFVLRPSGLRSLISLYRIACGRIGLYLSST